ncbi:MAG TPA: D-aminoacyl-tRNA deacylase [Terriglobales bacterium]|nr:D-aminoacyl-tRNA deacylase [Terriglobales bacterium]
MRAVVQRVSRASVSWEDGADGRRTHEIGRGLAVLVGAGPGDERADADALADKVAQLRIFSDAEGRFNLSLEDVAGEALVVSQFTLYADATRGRRPSFVGAAAPDCARDLFLRFADRLVERGVSTRTGSFGARMTVSLDNEGPVTIALSTDPWETRIRG